MQRLNKLIVALNGAIGLINIQGPEGFIQFIGLLNMVYFFYYMRDLFDAKG